MWQCGILMTRVVVVSKVAATAINVAGSNWFHDRLSGELEDTGHMRAGWVERLVRRSSQSEGGSDTHQLHLMEMMGFASSTHPTYCQPSVSPQGG
jgi:hypothetical protein